MLGKQVGSCWSNCRCAHPPPRLRACPRRGACQQACPNRVFTAFAFSLLAPRNPALPLLLLLLPQTEYGVYKELLHYLQVRASAAGRGAGGRAGGGTAGGGVARQAAGWARRWAAI